MKNRKKLGVFFTAFTAFQVNVYAATVTGKIAFEGRAPAAETIKMDADASCKLAHPDGAKSEEAVVNSNGTLKNVFVYVKEGVSGKFDAPKESVKFDQHGCQYTPRVLGIQVGQPLEILNSDPTLHNVHSLATKTQQFNLGMPIQGMKLKKTFTAPEIMVKVKCEVHPWMAGYIGVLDHPFFSATGGDGSFSINNLPPGEYVVEAWHEKYGTQTQKVSVAADGDVKELSFQYKAA